MTDRVEQLVREAGDWPVGEADTSAIAGRARRRQRRRRISAAVVLAVVVAAVSGIGAVMLGDEGDRGVVRVAGRDLVVGRGGDASFEWTPVSLPPAATQVWSVAGGPEGVIAVGTGGGAQTQPTDVPATWNVWYSSDSGATWTLVYSEPPIRLNSSFPPFYRSENMRNAYYANGMFVVTGDIDVPIDSNTAAGVWTSPDGITWTQSDDAPFRSSVPMRVRHKSTVAHSRLYDVTEWRGEIVAIGDLFTDNKRQPYGFSPAVWTSADGTSWKRRTVDLGDGVDPYLDSVTARGGQLVAGGRVDIWTAAEWSTRDLRTWTRSTITDSGAAQLDRTGASYFAVGTQKTGPKRKRIKPKDDTGIPTVWWSANARTWKPVLTLAEGAQDGAGNGPSFGRPAATDGFAIVAGPSRTFAGVTANRLYVSANGREWKQLSVPDQSTARSSLVLGADHDGVYVLGASGLGPSSATPTNPSTLWRVTVVDPESRIPRVDPNSPPPTRAVTVTALANLKFNATVYQVLAGDVKVAFVNGGGKHTLEFDDRSLRDVELPVSPAHPTTTARVRLERGVYAIYCAIPGHRAAGMEATLVVR